MNPAVREAIIHFLLAAAFAYAGFKVQWIFYVIAAIMLVVAISRLIMG